MRFDEWIVDKWEELIEEYESKNKWQIIYHGYISFGYSIEEVNIILQRDVWVHRIGLNARTFSVDFDIDGSISRRVHRANRRRRTGGLFSEDELSYVEAVELIKKGGLRIAKEDKKFLLY